MSTLAFPSSVRRWLPPRRPPELPAFKLYPQDDAALYSSFRGVKSPDAPPDSGWSLARDGRGSSEGGGGADPTSNKKMCALYA
jgi:hypothetical protein